jgi:hypothetical protein
MREMNAVQIREVAGALSTSDILNFFRSFGHSYTPPNTDWKPDPTPSAGKDIGTAFGIGVVVAAAVGALAVAGLLGALASSQQK